MSTDAIKWATLEQQERNALVAEKVFGRKILRDDSWGLWLLFHETKPGITEAIPDYTRNMNDALLVLKQVVQSEVADKETLTYELFDTTWGDLSTFDALERICAWTPEILCIAALESVGVDIE